MKRGGGTCCREGPRGGRLQGIAMAAPILRCLLVKIVRLIHVALSLSYCVWDLVVGVYTESDFNKLCLNCYIEFIQFISKIKRIPLLPPFYVECLLNSAIVFVTILA